MELRLAFMYHILRPLYNNVYLTWINFRDKLIHAKSFEFIIREFFIKK